MTEYVQVVLIANVFRVLCLVVGFGFAYLGYRLYAIGVFEKAQELKAAFGKANLTVKQVAPGVVFGIAGIVIAILGVVRPISVERTQTPAVTRLDENQLTPDKSDKLSPQIEHMDTNEHVNSVPKTITPRVQDKKSTVE